MKWWGVLCMVLFVEFVIPVRATTLEVFEVYQPLSLHGTDVDEEMPGFSRPLQVGIMSRPMVIQGAAPEALVAAVAQPHRLLSLSRPAAYNQPEANLLVLCGLDLSAKLEGRHCIIKLNVSKMVVPPQLDLAPKEVVLLVRLAVEKTLKKYYRAQFDEIHIEFRIDGVQNHEQRALRQVERRFTIKGKN